MKIKNYICLLTLMTLSLPGNTITAQNKIKMEEYELKAAFLIRFLDYVTWDNNSKNKTIEIAVIENSPISKSLTALAKNKNIRIQNYKNLGELNSCNILFVPNSCSVPIEQIISKFSEKPVLIVTEKEGSAKKGSHMNFIIVDSKLKFEVNLKAINKAGIGISSFLLQHAIVIQ